MNSNDKKFIKSITIGIITGVILFGLTMTCISNPFLATPTAIFMASIGFYITGKIY